MSATPDTLLTLIVPAALEDNVIDLLLDAPDLVAGFTTSAANGHGADVRLERANEKVRGHGRRIRFELVLSSGSLVGLRRYLRDALPDANLYFWTVAVRESGLLT